tara:strand:- start:2149 stop:2700 length:552 start_codon:yes stop_codon:yes gene_type:complete
MHGRDELAICAQVSLRYETPYLLPWVAYHTLLGFDSIILYIDDGTHLGAIDRTAHRRLLGMLGNAKHVTVHSMTALNQTGPGAQMAHCVFTARKHATWMAMWDIDEVPAMGPVPSTPLATVRALSSWNHRTPAALPVCLSGLHVSDRVLRVRPGRGEGAIEPQESAAVSAQPHRGADRSAPQF